MNYGKLVSKVRKAKAIPVKDVIGDFMSRSTYTRFVEGKHRISADNFIKILNNLHVSYRELMCVTGQRFLDPKTTHMLSHNSRQLKRLENRYESLFHQHQDVRYHYLACLMTLYWDHFSHQPLNRNCLNDLKNYLLSRPRWTFYELVLFKDVALFLSSGLLHLMTPRIIRDLKRYQHTNYHYDFTFQELFGIEFSYLLRKRFCWACQLFRKLKTYSVPGYMTTVYFSLKFVQGVIMMIKRNPKGCLIVRKCISIDEFLNDRSVANNERYFLSEIIKIYHLERG